MPDYRRYRVPGGTYFFTINLLERYPNDLLVRHIDLLRTVVRDVRTKRPFRIDAWVVSPDHLPACGRSRPAMAISLIDGG